MMKHRYRYKGSGFLEISDSQKKWRKGMAVGEERRGEEERRVDWELPLGRQQNWYVFSLLSI